MNLYVGLQDHPAYEFFRYLFREALKYYSILQVFNTCNVSSPCRWSAKNPYALNQCSSYSVLLRETILTDGATQEFQVRVTSSDFSQGTDEALSFFPFFFF